MKLHDSTIKEISIDKIESLRQSIGWRRRRSDEKWKEILTKSSFVYTVWDEEKLIGMGRIVEDGIMCMFYDFVVRKNYQGKGIGKKIMQKLVDEVKDKGYVSIGIFVWEENIDLLFPFYEKFGFEKVDTAMELKKYMI